MKFKVGDKIEWKWLSIPSKQGEVVAILKGVELPLVVYFKDIDALERYTLKGEVIPGDKPVLFKV